MNNIGDCKIYMIQGSGSFIDHVAYVLDTLYEQIAFRRSILRLSVSFIMMHCCPVKISGF